MRTITIEQCAAAMAACAENAISLQRDADLLRENERNARAFALYHCACEETAKFFMLEIVARKLTGGMPINWRRFWKRFRDHHSKMAQAGVRAFGIERDAETKLRTDAAFFSWFFSGIEPRNHALYVEIEEDGRAHGPNDKEWGGRLEQLASLVELLVQASSAAGHNEADIKARLLEPSEVNGERVVLRTMALAYLFTDLTAEQLHDAIDRVFSGQNIMDVLRKSTTEEGKQSADLSD